MRYVAGSWHQPYGSRSGDEEALGFGHGDGTVSGEIEGADLGELSTTSPRWRVDAEPAWQDRSARWESATPFGPRPSVQERAPGNRRAILARVELTTEADSYRWLNTCFLVGEGEIDEEREHWWLDTYVCVNERAKGPPAIGAEPPTRFRQPGRPGVADEA